MNTTPDAAERRKVSAVARQYEREGYRVTRPDRDGRLPSFLEGFTPDLIAESEHDRVVVEVKRSDAVRGANDLVEVAERVAGQSGWRFELVTLAARERLSPLSAERLDTVERQARQAMSAGMTSVAYLSAFAILEDVLRDMATRIGVKPAKLPFARIVRDLAVDGLMSTSDYEAIEQARSFRVRLLHSRDDPAPVIGDVEALLTLAHRLRDELAGTPAEN